MDRPTLPATADAVVVGGGIVGASCAFHLAAGGVRVVVLEANDGPAMGSTGRSAAGVRVQFSSEVNVRLSWESIKIYSRFLELYGDSAGYDPIGYLFLVPKAAWADHLAAVELQRSLDVPVEVLTTDAAQARVEHDATGLAGATFGPADGVIDPHSATLAYLRLAREQGATISFATPLLSASQQADTWAVLTPHGEVRAPAVVNAAGAWAGAVAQESGLKVPVEPVRRYVFATAPLPWRHRYPLTVDVASGFYLRSEGERVIFGRSNPREPAGFREGIDWDWLEPTLRSGLNRFPWLAQASLDRNASWWGYYETSPDHNAILGEMPGAAGWFNACGFSGHGVQQAPAVGRVIAEEVTLGRARFIDIDPLRMDRFSGERLGSESHIV